MSGNGLPGFPRSLREPPRPSRAVDVRRRRGARRAAPGLLSARGGRGGPSESPAARGGSCAAATSAAISPVWLARGGSPRRFAGSAVRSCRRRSRWSPFSRAAAPRRTRAAAVRFAGADAARRVRARPFLVPERWCGVGRRGTTTSGGVSAAWDVAVVGVVSGVPEWLGVRTSASDAARLGATSVSVFADSTEAVTRCHGRLPYRQRFLFKFKKDTGGSP